MALVLGTAPGKSQLFAYNTQSGVVRPMWFAGQDDGMSDSTPDATSTTMVTSTSTVASTVAPTSTGSVSAASMPIIDNGDDSEGKDSSDDSLVDPGTPDNANVASVTSLNSEGAARGFDEESYGDDTRPGFSYAAEEGAPSGSGQAQPMNVTLVFTPEMPVAVGGSPSSQTTGTSSSSDTVAATATAQDALSSTTGTDSAMTTSSDSSGTTVTAQDATSTTASSDSSSSTIVSADNVASPSSALLYSSCTVGDTTISQISRWQ